MVWDRLAMRRADIAVAQAATWDRLATTSVVIQPAVAIPGVWDRLATKSVTIQPTAPPPTPPTPPPTPPTPPPKEEEGIPTGLIIGSIVLLGGIAIAVGAKRS